jgi:hypothetical protein
MSEQRPEREVARLVLGADAELLPVVTGFVTATVMRAGLEEDAARRLACAAEVVCRNVVANAFGDEGARDGESGGPTTTKTATR